jgi:integrase/recombinase XerD
MKDFIGIFEDERYAVNAIWKARTSLRFFISYMESIDFPVESHTYLDYSGITPEVLDGFRKHLSGLGQKEATVKDHVFRIRQFLSFVESHHALTVPALHPVAVKPEGVESYPEEFRKAYYEYAQSAMRTSPGNFPERSLNRIKFAVKTFYRYLAEERNVEKFIDIRRNDIKEFTRYLMDLVNVDGNKKGSPQGTPRYSSNSVNIYLTIIRGFLTFLSKRGMCPGLADLIHSIKREVHLSKNILSRKDLVKLFNVKTENPAEFMMKTIIVLLYGSGLRIGEVLSLKFKDVDLLKKTAYILETKTNKERLVQLGEVATAYLKLYIDNIRGLIGYGQPNEASLSDNIFMSIGRVPSLSETVNANTVNIYLKDFCLRAGIKKLITCHCFRHSFGTHLLENGAGIKEVSELLGHNDLTTTELYTRLNPEHLRQTLLKYHPREAHPRQDMSHE